MAEYLHEEISRLDGYVKKAGKPRAGLVPLALTKDCEVVWGLQRIPLGTLQGKQMTDYDDEVERQRRLLCDSVLGTLAFVHPRFVEMAVKRVGRAIKTYWTNLKSTSGVEVLKNIVTQSSTRLYGPTSYGRRDEKTDIAKIDKSITAEIEVAKARIDMWFIELDKTPLNVPKLMSLYDFFYCKVLPTVGPTPTEKSRIDLKAKTWRPDWYEQTGPRGRVDAAGKKDVKTTNSPGLLSDTFTIPKPGAAFARCGVEKGQMKLQPRNRGWEMFTVNAKTMNDEFKTHLATHNLPFSASASGTTSTLFLAAEAFASISTFPVVEQKQYLLACVVYLVSGGMHTCDEVFWTGKNIGLLTHPHQYLEGLPSNFTSSIDGEKWQTEFWDIVRPDFKTVRGAPHRQMKTKQVAK